MITKIELDNFKSFCDFELLPGNVDLPAFVVLIGLNGSGKSTVLQALGFLASLVQGGPGPWLLDREWNDEELASRFKQRGVIPFKLYFKFQECESGVVWSGTYDISTRRCRTEPISSGARTILKLDEEAFALFDDKGTVVLEGSSASYTYSGSILSIIAEPKAHRAFLVVKKFMAGIKPLELLSPEQLRKRARRGRTLDSAVKSSLPFSMTSTRIGIRRSSKSSRSSTQSSSIGKRRPSNRGGRIWRLSRPIGTLPEPTWKRGFLSRICG
ncbi:MAG: AAA family ATPase [Rectinemataceae bacterium]